MNPILQRLYDLMAERGTNAKQVTEALHISASSFTDWKKGKASPGVEALSKMAPFFGVSLDYLITGHEYEPAEGTREAAPLPKEPETSNEKEISNPLEDELLSKFRRLPLECQGSVMSYMDGMQAALSRQALLSQTAVQQQVPLAPQTTVQQISPAPLPAADAPEPEGSQGDEEAQVPA